MNLWAVSRDATCEYFAAPSLEAAVAACAYPGDRAVPWAWPHLPSWHAQDAARFLDNFESEAMQ
jgi:hypothetical protein